jgi:hypothetical protein
MLILKIMHNIVFVIVILIFNHAFPQPAYPQEATDQWATVTSSELDTKQTGLRVYKPEKYYKGYTLFAHRQLDLPLNIPLPVYLIDMEGNIVYQWMVGGDTILARLKPDGHLVYATGVKLQEVDIEGNIVWDYPARVDHAFQILENGDFLINRSEIPKSGCNNEDPVTEIITPDKKIIWQWKGEEHIDKFKKMFGEKVAPCRQGRWLNNNSCEMLKDNPLAKKDGRFRKGNILCCFNGINILAIIDHATKEVVWSWPREEDIIQSPHGLTMLDNGNILIFDNGNVRGWSRVIELNPLTKKIAWEYHGEPKESFHSAQMANAQRLPNGNTLICEGAKNRIFEITPKGEIVWDFISTFNKTAGSELIYQASRYSPDYVKPLLEQIKKLQITQKD